MLFLLLTGCAVMDVLTDPYGLGTDDTSDEPICYLMGYDQAGFAHWDGSRFVDEVVEPPPVDEVDPMCVEPDGGSDPEIGGYGDFVDGWCAFVWESEGLFAEPVQDCPGEGQDG